MRAGLWPLLFSLVPFPIPSVAAQAGQTLLGIPSLNGFNLVSTTSPLLYMLPPSAPSITISFALCSTNLPLPRVFVSNSTMPGPTVGPNGAPETYEVTFEQGVGAWTGEAPTGASIGVYVGQGALNSSSWQFEIAVQEGETPAHTIDTNLPTLADTSSTRAIVFSTTFQNITVEPTSYPNYTLPALDPYDSFSFPTYLPPSSLLLLPTPAQLSALPYFRSSCALRAMQSSLHYNATQTNLVRSPETGWQTEFVVPGGLAPQTNYTVWVTQGPKISGPIYMQTKSEAFDDTCTFVHALPYCPLVSYPIPLVNTTQATTPDVYNSTNLPIEISSNITGFLANFSINLGTFACGRDVYSPLHDCTDCMDAYRTWACYVSFPRCAEPATNSTSTSTPSPPLQPQVPFALKPIATSDPPRALGFPNATTPYTEVLPCIETCNAVHRNCPPFLGWQCPDPDQNANDSYALGVLDSDDGHHEGEGILGGRLRAGMGDVMGVVDVWGNVWCNGA
ncbi:stretch-activated cation channel mid1 [Tulasnella sp. JGI-2019a]|nr:stretch-activated cation channel mid1 [Tulasnella sp. JGI-2019a]